MVADGYSTFIEINCLSINIQHFCYGAQIISSDMLLRSLVVFHPHPLNKMKE